MTTINALNERIIYLQDKQIKDLEKARELDKKLHAAELKHTEDLYAKAVAHVAAERDAAIELAEDYKQDVQHWQNQADREHRAFEQAAEERDQVIRDNAGLRRHNEHLTKERVEAVNERDSYKDAFEAQVHTAEIAESQKAQAIKELEKALTKQASLEQDTKLMSAFIDNLCEMVACDAELSDIADECMLWRRGEWVPTDSIEGMIGSIIDKDPGSFFGGSNTVYVDDAVYRGTPWVTAVTAEESDGAPAEEELSVDEMLEDLSQYLEDDIEDLQAEDRRRSDPSDVYRWKVLVVEHQGDEAVFTGFYANYDLARESVDLMVARGCYEAWVEELL